MIFKKKPKYILYTDEYSKKFRKIFETLEILQNQIDTMKERIEEVDSDQNSFNNDIESNFESRMNEIEEDFNNKLKEIKGD